MPPGPSLRCEARSKEGKVRCGIEIACTLGGKEGGYWQSLEVGSRANRVARAGQNAELGHSGICSAGRKHGWEGQGELSG